VIFNVFENKYQKHILIKFFLKDIQIYIFIYKLYGENKQKNKFISGFTQFWVIYILIILIIFIIL
jgi:hypothetical protein